MTDGANTDKRTRRRMRLALPAHIQFVSGDGEAMLDGRTRDVSNGGAYLFCEQTPGCDGQLVAGALLLVSLTAPPDRGRQWTIDIECEAEVVRVEPPASGHQEYGVAVRILRFSMPKVMPLPEVDHSARVYIPAASHWVN